ncbi:unnamed protein product [Lasius platythorax]|uniref:Uncharacterized protein n=1 Tax=Lasius platythorax TaxID=488582 RepID=A0AAV2N3U0_9HYME
MQRANPDFVSWDTTDRSNRSDLEQVNSDVSRKYVSAEVAEKRGSEGKDGETRVMRPERDKERENRPETRRREKVKRTVPRNVTYEK